MINRDWRAMFQRWGDQLKIRYALLTFGTAAAFATLTGFLNPAVESENVRALLTTLATAEASVLAIVFSVTVVALQLVVPRYSARLTSLFVKEPLFRATFALFVIAIAFNLVVVYLLPVQNGRLTNAAVGIAFALAAVSTLSLYQFIRLMIQRSSPDEFISVLVERELAPDKYLETIEEFHKIEVHPIRPLYRTIARAIELGEYQTAEQGIDGLRMVLARTFEHLETEYSEESAAEYATAVSTEVLTEYFPPILEQAHTHEQYDLVSNGVDNVEVVALDALDRGFSSVTKDAADGLGEAFDAAPLTWGGNRLRDPITETLVALTEATAKRADYGTYSSVFFELNHQMSVLLRRRPDTNVTRRLVGNYYRRDTIDIFEALVERYGPNVQHQEVNWIFPTEDGKWTLPEEAKPLRNFWREYLDLTQSVLRYRVAEGEYPIAEGSLDDGWKQAVECAADAGMNRLATLFCITKIQLAYRIDQLEDDHVSIWINNLGLLRRDYDPTIVDQAFSILKTGKTPEGGNINVQTDTGSNGSDYGLLSRLFPSGEDESFQEWLVDFEEEVKDRTEFLKERQ